jgi:hypothetical protein
MMDGVNITRVLLDEKLRAFIERAKREMETDRITSINLLTDTRLNFQDRMRDYILKHQGELNVDKNGTINRNNKPDIYALMICFITDLDRCDRWEDVMEQNKQPDKSMDYKIGVDEMKGVINGLACACGKECNNVFLIKNEITERTLLLGCDCIMKYDIVNEEQMKEMNKKRAEYISEVKRKNCEKCRDYQMRLVGITTCLDCILELNAIDEKERKELEKAEKARKRRVKQYRKARR